LIESLVGGMKVMKELKQGLVNNRQIPDWGNEVFSKEVVCIRPETPEQSSEFIRYSSSLTEAYLKVKILLLNSAGLCLDSCR